MKHKVLVEKSFEKPARRLARKYPSFTRDLLNLIDELECDPLLGVSLGGSLRKVRLAIKSKGRGKSGGARVISFVYLAGKRVHLLTVYDKAAFETLADQDLKALVRDFEKSRKDKP